MEQTAQDILKQLFELLGIDVQINITSSEDDKGKVLNVSVDAPDESGLLIGSQGMTLGAIQTFLAVALKQQTGEWVRVVLDIGAYRGRQEEHLVNLAKQAAARAKSTGEEQPLYNLTPAQRRLVHVSLADDTEVETESMGEGNERYLVVKLKSSK